MCFLAVRTTAIGLLALTICRLASAQEDVVKIPAPEKVNVTCAYPAANAQSLRFTDLQAPSLDAQIVVSNMLQSLSVKMNIPVFIGPVQGVAAVTFDGQVAIVYNPDYLRSVYEKTGKNQWAVIFLLAHELGHHVNFDTFKDGGTTPRNELRADFLSGWMMRRLGVSLDGTLTAVRAEEIPDKTDTRKALETRIKQITDGYQAAEPKTAVDPASGSQNPTNESKHASLHALPRQVPCTHRLPCSHDVPCQHHLACRHRVACTHKDQQRTLHKYDLAHLFDLEHPADPEHPYDTEHPYDAEMSPPPEKARPFSADVSPFFQKY
jgi:hypothetical protein